jgi:hypothetical protein
MTKPKSRLAKILQSFDTSTESLDQMGQQIALKELSVALQEQDQSLLSNKLLIFERIKNILYLQDNPPLVQGFAALLTKMSSWS